MTLTIVILLLIVGSIPGYYAGRWRAEWGRTWHEMSRARKGRSAYRK